MFITICEIFRNKEINANLNIFVANEVKERQKLVNSIIRSVSEHSTTEEVKKRK